ncbi:hypothetical protein [Pseudoalteromonas sp. Of7M-16]|uniref:hypothetical protein n=1 Tax=Pseudoalteromonas sp. Of7M-16 TaxID=2917756 RepID=UPI001EF6FB21|nr:hypothetical protein [Pseudoalteromonas sp. Of7M-16]MCG7550885.1 hypothetical protein [Pseudoalteromonas sp. Of7M-16]
MKKLLLMAGLVAMPVLAEESSGWKRSSSSTYVYSVRTSAPDLTFRMHVAKANKEKEAAEILLINPNSRKCMNGFEGIIYSYIFNVDHREVKYKAQCNQGDLIFMPATDAGARYVAQRFNKYGSGVVTYTLKIQGSPDLTFTAPKKGFRDFYSEVEIASREAL